MNTINILVILITSLFSALLFATECEVDEHPEDWEPKAYVYNDCDGKNGKGPAIGIRIGHYNMSTLSAQNVNNDTIDAIRADGVKVHAYSDNDYKGAVEVISPRTDQCLKINRNKVSSLIVRKDMPEKPEPKYLKYTCWHIPVKSCETFNTVTGDPKSKYEALKNFDTTIEVFESEKKIFQGEMETRIVRKSKYPEFNDLVPVDRYVMERQCGVIESRQQLVIAGVKDHPNILFGFFGGLFGNVPEGRSLDVSHETWPSKLIPNYLTTCTFQCYRH